MSTLGAFPLDPTSPVGRLRSTLGDTDGSPDPEQPHIATYAVFSDADLAGYLIEGDDSVLRAAAIATTRMALEYSTLGKSVRTEDLTIDLKSRGRDLLEVAKSFAEDADAADARTDASFLAIVPTGRRRYAGIF